MQASLRLWSNLVWSMNAATAARNLNLSRSNAGTHSSARFSWTKPTLVSVWLPYMRKAERSPAWENIGGAASASGRHRVIADQGEASAPLTQGVSGSAETTSTGAFLTITGRLVLDQSCLFWSKSNPLSNRIHETYSLVRRCCQPGDWQGSGISAQLCSCQLWSLDQTICWM